MKPRICVLAYMIPPHYGGAGRLAVYYSRNIKKAGRNVELLTCTPTPDPVDEVDLIEFKLPEWYELKGGGGLLSRSRRHFYDAVIILRLRRYYRKNNIQLVHCLAAKWFSLLAVAAANLAGIPSILETTLLDSDDALSIKERKLGWLQAGFFKTADRIVNQSPALQEASLRAGLPPEKCQLIVNPANVHRFHPVESHLKQQLRKSLGLEKFKYVLITVGVVRPRKNTADIVNLFLSIADTATDSCLVILGPHDKDAESREYSSQLIEQINEKNMHDRVLFAGEVGNVPEWMQAADLFLFASHAEGLPLVMPEALASGLPIISTPIQGVAGFVVKHGQTGYVVEDMAKGAEFLLQLLKEPEELDKFSRDAREDAVTRFSEEVVMGQYFELYDSLTSST